ncbi:MAG: hypothetical protein FD143_1430 [Ignavibacteria bacterium]|nr:MAG: hypothetical protein FD143_1430 [Ignavibacteria bacterium]KAF0160481.1 MAG: hypothetical protein FD188_1655 [Ignavibacteria bacterium]
MNLLKKHYATFTSLIVFIVYLFTLAPSVIQIDSGELAAVQATLGIAHPTGYPLFTIIGYLWLKTPLPFSKIFQANLLAAVWCSLSIFFLIKIVEIVFNNFKQNVLVKKSKQRMRVLESSFTNDQKIISAFAGSFYLAFSKTFWMQSTSVEVYSLQAFLFTLILFFTLRAYYTKTNKYFDWVFVGITFAFSFANHMTTLLILPLAAILFFMKERFTQRSFKIIVVTAVTSLPLLALLYLYLPLRASMQPLLNWGNPVNFENFWRHFTGKQYQVWLFASFEAAGKQLKYFLTNFSSEFAYAGLILGLIGFVFLFKNERKMFIALLFTFLFAVLYSVNYDIVDIDSYFLLAYIIFALFISLGFSKLLQLLKSKAVQDKYAYAAVGLLCFLPLGINRTNVDQSGVYTFEDYTKAVLNSTEKNSIVFSYQWDYFISASYYFQNVENYRKDVVVVDKELLRRSWYYSQLQNSYPSVMKQIETETNSFVEAVKPFERDQNFDANLLEQNYRAVMSNLIVKNINERNCYISIELYQNEMRRGEFTLPDGCQLVPHSLMFKVVKGTDYVPAPEPNFTVRFPKNRNKYVNFIENTCGTMLAYRAAYELEFGFKERAKVYLDKAKKDFPNYQIPYQILSGIN